MKQETKRRIEISNLHEFADSLMLIDNRIERCKKHQASTIVPVSYTHLDVYKRQDYSGLHYRSYDLPIISSDTIQTQRVEEMKEISDHIMRL